METQKRTAQVGDMVYHHGHEHEIKRIEPRAEIVNDEVVRTDVVVFENGGEKDGFLVKASLDELVWSDELNAWYLPGRVLTNDERTVIAALTGTWPPAETHLAMMKFLDMQGPLDKAVDPGRLLSIVRERRMAKVGPQKEDESGPEYEARIVAYAAGAVAHAEQHRLERAERRAS